jgi:hypothetical protein
MSFAVGFGPNCESQTVDPAVKVHAYEREVVGGIPGGPPGGGSGPARMRYVIFLETPPGAAFAVDGVWIKGAYYKADTAARKAPVRFETPVALADETQNVAVPATTNTVTEITPNEAVADTTLDANDRDIVRQNDAVVRMTYAGKRMLVPIKKLARGAPLYLR